ncbi:ABC transporter permease [Sporichthya sp.]|uniref:branched-chain amino acid ABC transporter permease n=1 Tax=Sporichthya sp. TaxID=65475 RepID=UPI0017FB5693|nr:ABC transporter permease [Sporichthya sp.]MBA3741635.1 ABC transporter permease [Sporichthya sp.]
MNEYIPYIIFGVTSGAVFGISAMGLVLTYKTSGVFNIAHGAVCAAGAYVFYSLRQQADLPWPVAAALVVCVFGPLMGIVLERLAVAFSGVPTAFKIVGTVGLLVALQSLITLIYGSTSRVFDPFLPQGEAFSVSGTKVNYEQVIILLLGFAAAGALVTFFRLSRLGTAMRGVVDDPALLDLTGDSPTRVRRYAWIIGSSFAAMSGVLFASTQAQIDVNVLTLLVVQAFGAATIARFQSLPLCIVGGIVVGLLQKLVSKEITAYPDLQGLDLATPFIVLFIGLLVIPRRKLVETGRQIRAKAVPPSRVPRPFRAAGYGTTLLVALAIPQLWFVGAHLPAYNQALTQVTLFVSLHLLVRTSGQISLCHFGFAAIGAIGLGHMQGYGMPFALAVIIGGLLCIPPALLIAIPAIRLSGLYLALATLGFGIMLAQFCYGKSYMFGFGSLATERPAGFSDDETYYYLLLGVAVASVIAVLVIERSRLGRVLRGLSDSPVALQTLGLSVNVARVIVFCISGFMAGISGALYGSLFGSVSASTFNYVNSLVILAVLAISGRRVMSAAIVAPVLLYVIPNYIGDPDMNTMLQMAFGLAAMFAAANAQGGWDVPFTRLAERSSDRLRGPAEARLRRLEAHDGPSDKAQPVHGPRVPVTR